MVPYGWGNRTLKLTIWWWTGGTGNVYWVTEIRRLQAGGGLLSAATYDGGAVVGANNVIAKTTITYSGTANIVEGEALKLRIYRYGTHASDTRAASAFLLAAKVSVVD